MIIGFVGLPRSGKSSKLALYALKNQHLQQLNSLLDKLKIPPKMRFKCYSCVYSNEYIKGTVKYDAKTLGAWKPLPNSLIIINEAGVYFNNREFKSLPSYTAELFAKHGHLGCDIVWDSQTADVDIKLRQRTQEIWLVRKPKILALFHRSLLLRVRMNIDVNDQTQKLEDMYARSRGFFGFLVGLLLGDVRIFSRRPSYKMFNSYSDTTIYKQSAPSRVW